FFDRRNRPGADALADETFRRIGRALVADEAVVATKSPAPYCYEMATRVPREDGADPRVTRVPATPASMSTRQCPLDGLAAGDRQLLIDYYRDGRFVGHDSRRDLAERLHIAPRTLAARAARLRDAVMRSINTR